MTLPGTRPIPERARDLLEGMAIAHMSTVRADGRLSTNPVGVLLDGDHLRISTTKRRVKYRNLLRDPRIALSIPHATNPNRYLEVRGHALLEDDADRSFIDRIARISMGMERYPFDPPGEERVIITVIAEQMSCPAIPLADDPPTAGTPRTDGPPAPPSRSGLPAWALLASGVLIGLALAGALMLLQWPA